MSDWFARHREEYGPDWDDIAATVKEFAGWECEACGAPHGPPPNVLTVDHLNHDHTDHRWPENLVALCQRCHLARQGMRPRPLTRARALGRLREWNDRFLQIAMSP